MKFAMDFLQAADEVYAAMKASGKAPCPAKARMYAATVRQSMVMTGEPGEKVALFERNFGVPFPPAVYEHVQGRAA